MKITTEIDRRKIERDVLRSFVEDIEFQKESVLSRVSQEDFETPEFREVYAVIQISALQGKSFDYPSYPGQETITEILCDGVSLNGEWSAHAERLKIHKYDSDEKTLSELGLAKRFSEQHGTGARFNHADRTFLFYQDGFWQEDETCVVYRRMEETIQGIYAEAERQTDGEQRKRIAAFALKCEGKTFQTNAIELVKTQPTIAITAKELDRDPYLLNLMNGTIDLRTCDIRPHDHRDHITRRLNVVFNPKAEYRGSWWEKFLNQIFNEDQEMILFVQRSFGYMLSGLTDEQYLWFLFGSGANGKSTLIKILYEIFGAYMQTAPSNLLLLKKNEGASPDVARLRGARIVVSQELEAGRRLNESLVKSLTGGDRIVARSLYCDFQEFDPTHKTLLAGNHKPEIRGTEDAIWRRVLLIPFEKQIPVDKRRPLGELVAHARRESSPIFNWLLDGWLKYKAQGLAIPEKVRLATQEYRDESDTLAQFIAEVCVAPGEACTTDFHKAYVEWSGSAISQKGLFNSMKEKGFQIRQGARRKRFWIGIGLAAEEGRA